jgi:hypothetical protein
VLRPGGRDACAPGARVAQRLAMRMLDVLGVNALEQLLGAQERLRQLGEAVHKVLEAWGEHVFAKVSGCADGSARSAGREGPELESARKSEVLNGG